MEFQVRYLALFLLFSVTDSFRWFWTGSLDGVYTHFESFLPTVYKFGMVYSLAYRCSKICCNWTKFHEELSFLKQVLKFPYKLELNLSKVY